MSEFINQYMLLVKTMVNENNMVGIKETDKKVLEDAKLHDIAELGKVFKLKPNYCDIPALVGESVKELIIKEEDLIRDYKKYTRELELIYAKILKGGYPSRTLEELWCSKNDLELGIKKIWELAREAGMDRVEDNRDVVVEHLNKYILLYGEDFVKKCTLELGMKTQEMNLYALRRLYNHLVTVYESVLRNRLKGEVT